MCGCCVGWVGVIVGKIKSPRDSLPCGGRVRGVPLTFEAQLIFCLCFFFFFSFVFFCGLGGNGAMMVVRSEVCGLVLVVFVVLVFVLVRSSCRVFLKEFVFWRLLLVYLSVEVLAVCR